MMTRPKADAPRSHLRERVFRLVHNMREVWSPASSRPDKVMVQEWELDPIAARKEGEAADAGRNATSYLLGAFNNIAQVFTKLRDKEDLGSA